MIDGINFNGGIIFVALLALLIFGTAASENETFSLQETLI